MSKIFGIADLPIAKPFPSLDYSINSVPKSFEEAKQIIDKVDIYAKKNISKKKFLKNFFTRVKH